MKYAVLVVVLFTLIYFGFHADTAMPTFDEIFAFGYTVTIRPLEVLASVKDGIDVFISELIAWFKALFA